MKFFGWQPSNYAMHRIEKKLEDLGVILRLRQGSNLFVMAPRVEALGKF